MLFDLGNIVGTPAALTRLERLGITPSSLITRHVTGDWGDLTAEDKAANDRALEDGSRIFSSYNINKHDEDDKVWIITEAVNDNDERFVTTVLLPSDY